MVCFSKVEYKGIPPHFRIWRIDFCKNMKYSIPLKVLFSQFKSFINHWESTQLIFCFCFVLTGRFHTVQKRPTQQLKWKVAWYALEALRFNLFLASPKWFPKWAWIYSFIGTAYLNKIISHILRICIVILGMFFVTVCNEWQMKGFVEFA